MLQQESLKWLTAMTKDLDYEGLQEKGLLVQGDDAWWEVTDIGSLPYDVTIKIEKMSLPAGHICGCPGKRIKVKFCPPSAIKKAQELLKDLRPANAMPFQRINRAPVKGFPEFSGNGVVGRKAGPLYDYRRIYECRESVLFATLKAVKGSTGI